MKIDITSFLDAADIPETRRPLTEANVKWLLRNLGIRNRNKPGYAEVMQELAAISDQN